MNEEIVANSPSPRDQLTKHLLDKGISDAEISLFFTDFEVPENLKFLRCAANRLVKTLTEFAPLKYSAPPSLVASLKISTLITEITELPETPAFFEGEDSADISLRGLIEGHPLYALILSNGLNNVQINYFLGHFLPCYLNWRDVCATQSYLTDNACREARRLIFPSAFIEQTNGTRRRTPLKALAHFVTLLPARQTSQVTYVKEFEKHFATVKPLSQFPIELEAIETLLAVFCGEAPAPRPPTDCEPSTSKKKRSEGKYIQHNLLPGSAIQTITVTELGAEDDEPDDGGDPDESSAMTYTFQKLKPKAPVYSTEDDRYQIIANKNRSDVFARANQALHLSTDNLNSFDIEQLCAAIRSASQTKESDKEVLAFLSLQTVLGQPSSSLLDGVLNSGKSLPKSNTLGYSKSGVIVFRPWSGQAKDLENRESTAPVAKELRIKIPQAAHEIVALWLAGPKPKSGDKIFVSEPSQLLKRAGNFLLSLNEELGTRLSLTRLEGFLYRSLCQLPSGDPSVAILLTGQITNYGHSSAFYNGWRIDQLHDFYRSHLDFLGEWTAISADWRDGHVIIDENPEYMAGSRFVPTVGAIGTYANELRKIMRRASHNPPRHSPLIAKHNLYVAGLYGYLSFSLGSRAVSHLILHPDCINLDLGVMYISDKDDRHYRHGRLCPLPELAIQAFRDLEDHLDALASHLMVINQDSAQQIAKGLYAPPTGDRLVDLDEVQKNPPLLFFLDVDGEIAPLRPSACMDIWIDRSKLKMNSPRHAFRTGSRTAGNPDAIVRSVMGHWQTGTETMGRFSTLQPKKIREFAEGWMSQQMHIDDKQRWCPPISPLLK